MTEQPNGDVSTSRTQSCEQTGSSWTLLLNANIFTLLARIIHDNWMFDCKLFEDMILWQTHLKQSAHAGVPAV